MADTDAGEIMQELQERETLLGAFFQEAPVPTFVIDQEHRVRRWNRAIEVLSGIPAADISVHVRTHGKRHCRAGDIARGVCFYSKALLH